MKKPEPKAAPPKPDDVGASAAPSQEGHAREGALEKEIAELRKETGQLREKYLRARADYENLAKRTAKDAQDTIRFVKGGLLLRLAGLRETLERLARDLGPKLGSERRGLELVVEEASRILSDEGVAEIPTTGEAFNYRLHQAVERVETRDHPEATILGVIQRGYKLGDEVLRPALVRVAAPPPGAGEAGATSGAKE